MPDFLCDVRYGSVLGDYFQAMGVPLLRGRFFTPADDQKAQQLVIISQALADKFFAGRDPIGGRLKLGLPAVEHPGRWWLEWLVT